MTASAPALSRPAQHWRGVAALTTDQVLCSGQLERLGVSADLFPGLRETVRVTDSFRSERTVTFHALRPTTLHLLSGTQLMHLAGLAELRLALGVEPGPHWQSVAHAVHVGGTPDGEWNGARLEFDSGHYDVARMHAKLQAFTADGAQVYWGMTSALRVSRWAARYPNVTFLYVPWWHDVQERAQAAAGQVRGRAAAREARAISRNTARARQLAGSVPVGLKRPDGHGG
ncbi:hypothetical protein [Deinococcus multiflagellatus]|uniref:Uncharacterized protein n=1 Tax=Deinococcus multiflagellatus TaxID=1656887 RepID=A0ABW1ZU80_9DEIO|nr:hypothetical protein [Deinococcus multiflagellatus]MBZ9714437.1 hypothetical protein [Deinococcus multiflagellatus]